MVLFFLGLCLCCRSHTVIKSVPASGTVHALFCADISGFFRSKAGKTMVVLCFLPGHCYSDEVFIYWVAKRNKTKSTV